MCARLWAQMGRILELKQGALDPEGPSKIRPAAFLPQTLCLSPRLSYLPESLIYRSICQWRFTTSFMGRFKPLFPDSYSGMDEAKGQGD